jgi:NifU-like protein involved in Fe-S cluster formation
MSAGTYSARVRELFAMTPHAGDVVGAESVSTADQDVRIRLSASVEDGAVTAMRFRAWGCPHLIAGAEAACAALEGHPVAGLPDWTAADLMEDLAVPVEKTGRILVVEDAVRSLGQKLCDGT